MLENFDIEKVKARETMSVTLSVRITQKEFNWLKENRVSATKLFRYALKEVMKKPIKDKKK